MHALRALRAVTLRYTTQAVVLHVLHTVQLFRRGRSIVPPASAKSSISNGTRSLHASYAAWEVYVLESNLKGGFTHGEAGGDLQTTAQVCILAVRLTFAQGQIVPRMHLDSRCAMRICCALLIVREYCATNAKKGMEHWSAFNAQTLLLRF